MVEVLAVKVLAGAENDDGALAAVLTGPVLTSPVPTKLALTQMPSQSRAVVESPERPNLVSAPADAVAGTAEDERIGVVIVAVVAVETKMVLDAAAEVVVAEAVAANVNVMVRRRDLIPRIPREAKLLQKGVRAPRRIGAVAVV